MQAQVGGTRKLMFDMRDNVIECWHAKIGQKRTAIIKYSLLSLASLRSLWGTNKKWNSTQEIWQKRKCLVHVQVID